MIFRLASSRADVHRTTADVVSLVVDDWDDYGFKTTFYLYYCDAALNVHEIGGVKIGQFGMTSKIYDRPVLPAAFNALEDQSFSVGQDDSYYAKMNTLSPPDRMRILGALNDIAYDPDIFQRVITEPVTGKSLLRFSTLSTVARQFNRMAHGGSRLSDFSFSYTFPVATETLQYSRPEMTFAVSPESQPPTNVHVVIGRNGVGKSVLLKRIADLLVKQGHADESSGQMMFDETSVSEMYQPASKQFANLISVAFSAFDDFTPYSSSPDKSKGMPYTYIGLKKVPRTSPDRPEKPTAPKSSSTLAREFSISVKSCVTEARKRTWRRALEILQSDPIFADAQVSELADSHLSDDYLLENARSLYQQLSSGHKIVLLTMTRLVESMEERSLVLLDEPESHLHPPLLSAFVRALSDLLIYRNGVAIIATHSPVILQEVPRSCVWRLRRSGSVVAIDRPSLETFGENVGTLTHEIFGLEVTNSGFHRMIAEYVQSGVNYDAVIGRFNGNLGSEARALVQALIAARDAEVSY